MVFSECSFRFSARLSGNQSNLLSSTVWRIRRNVPSVSPVRRFSAAGSWEISGVSACPWVCTCVCNIFAEERLLQNLNIIVILLDVGASQSGMMVPIRLAYNNHLGSAGGTSSQQGARSHPRACGCQVCPNSASEPAGATEVIIAPCRPRV